MPTREWVQDEYTAWESALAGCTVNDFKLVPAVRRMLSLDLGLSYDAYHDTAHRLSLKQWQTLERLDAIGMGGEADEPLSVAGLRFAHWAFKIIDAVPASIVEIGGGCGQLYATLRVLGWKGKYGILDLPKVQTFQHRYLNHVGNVFGFDTALYSRPPWDMAVSFYALGEFTDEIRKDYIDRIVSKCPKGLLVWNPIDYASPEIPLPFAFDVEDEVPLTAPGNKVVRWGLK